MSYDGSRRDRALDNDPYWERLMLKAVSAPPPRPAHHGDPQPVQHVKPHPAQDVAGLRKANPVNHLLPASNHWLKSLPREVRPIALVTRYARLVNLLAEQWNDHDACAACFDHLLWDRRGNRQGFPAAVKSDLRLLQEYFLHLETTGTHRSTMGR